MATIQDKNRKTTGRVDSRGNLYDNTHNRPTGRIHDGGIYDKNGKLTGRYQNGKIYDKDGPWGGKVVGHYENGKIYDKYGHWGGKVTGRYSGNVFDEDSGYDHHYYASSSRNSSTISDVGYSSASYSQQNRGSGTWLVVLLIGLIIWPLIPVAIYIYYKEKKASRALVQPKGGQGRGISFLMSKCQQCGRFTRGKYYPLLLILTPFALLFYTIIIVAFAYFALFEQSGGNILVGIIASIIGILIFLLPGLAVLYLLKRPKCVCDSCVQRTSQDDLGIKKHQEVDERATHQAEDDSRLPRQQVDMIVINSLLENNPAAKDIINRNSSSVTILTIPLVQSVIQATEYERTRDFEASAKIYDELLWWDEARRVRAGTI